MMVIHTVVIPKKHAFERCQKESSSRHSEVKVGQGPAVLAAGAGRVGYFFLYFSSFFPF